MAVFTAVSAATAFTTTAFARGFFATFTEAFKALTSSVPLKNVCALHAEFMVAVAMVCRPDGRDVEVRRDGRQIWRRNLGSPGPEIDSARSSDAMVGSSDEVEASTEQK